MLEANFYGKLALTGLLMLALIITTGARPGPKGVIPW